MLAWRFSVGFLLTVHTTYGQDDACSFSADAVGYEGVSSESMNRTTFICEGSGEYVTEIIMVAGWWIDGFQVLCSSGEESPWFGDPEGGNATLTQAQGGWTSITATTINFNGAEYPSLPYVFVYNTEEGQEDGKLIGPFGSQQPSEDYGDESISECGSESWANGVTIIDNEDYVLGLQLECQSATDSACLVPEGILVPMRTLAPTTAPIPETPSPDIRVDFRGDCTVNSCDANLCCSETGECGGTSNYCRQGRCCPSDDESDCELGTNQCLIESEEPVAWYESPAFIGVSTAAGLVAAIGGGGYTLYRHMKCGGCRVFTQTPTT